MGEPRPSSPRRLRVYPSARLALLMASTKPRSSRGGRRLSQGRVAMIFIETPANPTNGLVDIAMIRRVADDDRPNPRSYAARRLRQHASRPRVSAADRTRRGSFTVLPDEIHRRPLRPHRGCRARLESPHERRESFARSHRHPTRSAFLLDAQPVARNIEHPYGKSRRNARLVADYLRDHAKVAKVHYLGHLRRTPPPVAYSRGSAPAQAPRSRSTLSAARPPRSNFSTRCRSSSWL